MIRLEKLGHFLKSAISINREAKGKIFARAKRLLSLFLLLVILPSLGGCGVDGVKVKMTE